MSSVSRKVLQQYMMQLQLHPIRTKAITAGFLQAMSDIVSQKLTGTQKIQLRQLILKVLFGAAYLGPSGHYFHNLVDKLFKGKNDTKTVAKKVLLDQLTFSPMKNFAFMIYYALVVEGRTWNQVKSKIKKDYPRVQLTSWMFWPIVGWINFQFLPLQLRVVFQSFVGFCWGIFLNLRARSTALPKAR